MRIIWSTLKICEFVPTIFLVLSVSVIIWRYYVVAKTSWKDVVILDTVGALGFNFHRKLEMTGAVKWCSAVKDNELMSARAWRQCFNLNGKHEIYIELSFPSWKLVVCSFSSTNIVSSHCDVDKMINTSYHHQTVIIALASLYIIVASLYIIVIIASLYIIAQIIQRPTVTLARCLIIASMGRRASLLPQFLMLVRNTKWQTHTTTPHTHYHTTHTLPHTTHQTQHTLSRTDRTGLYFPLI